MTNLYEILGVAENATDSEIKKAYYQQAKKYHPDKNKDKDTTEQMQLIANAHDILSSPEKRQIYDESLHKKDSFETKVGFDKDPNFVMNIDKFWLALIYLSPEMRTLVFEKVKSDLPNMIKSIVDFNKALEFLDDQQRMQVFEMMKNQLPSMFSTKENFINTFTYLKIEAIKDSLSILLTSSMDFGDLMEYSTPEERPHIFEAMKNKLPALYKDVRNFSDIFKFLDSKQRQEAFEILQKSIVETTRSWDDLFQVFEYLNLEQCQALLVMVKDRLSEKLKDLSSLTHECRALNPQLLEMVLTTLKGTLITFVKNEYIPRTFDLLSDTLKKLGDERRIFFLQGIIDNLPWIQVNTEKFNKLLNYYFQLPEERLLLLKAMQATLTQVIPINTLDNFVTTYFSDNTHQQKVKQLYFTALLDEFKNRLNHNDITECGLLTMSFMWVPNPDSFNNLKDRLHGKDAILKSSLEPELFYADQKTKSVTRIFTGDGGKSDGSLLCREMSDSYRLANDNELKLIKSITGRTKTSDGDKIVLQVLYDSLNNASQLYFNQKPTSANYSMFQKLCDDALRVARKELKNPDAWKNTLVIKGLNVFRLGGLSITNSNSGLSFFKTESERKIDDIANQIDKFRLSVMNH